MPEEAIVATEEGMPTTQEQGTEEAPQEQEEVEHLKAALEEREARIAALEHEKEQLRSELELALQKYRASLLASAPEIPEELVQGSTVREIDEAYAHARAMVERIRSQVEAQTARERIPAGAPVRSAPDLSSLSAREKIAYALSRR